MTLKQSFQILKKKKKFILNVCIHMVQAARQFFYTLRNVRPKFLFHFLHISTENQSFGEKLSMLTYWNYCYWVYWEHPSDKEKIKSILIINTTENSCFNKCSLFYILYCNFTRDRWLFWYCLCICVCV